MAALPAPRIAASLGGRAKLKRDVRRDSDLERLIREGIPGSAVRFFIERHGLGADIISAATGVKGRTLERRLRERFLPAESDRLVRFVTLYLGALHLHEGDDVATTRWFYEEVAALEHERLIDHVDNEIGSRFAERLLDEMYRQRRRPIGLAAGQFRVDQRFFDPLDDEMLAAFSGQGR